MPKPNRSSHPWERGPKSRKPLAVRRILILCEDTKSSRDYFASFPVNRSQVEIDCVGAGKNTDSLMEEAVERKKEGNYQVIWVVFDKDDFSEHQFNRAFELAGNHNDIVACWSNECFELWYLLHYDFLNTGISRQDIVNKLKTRMGEEYDKADKSMYSKLLHQVETAIKNADRLARKNAEGGEPRGNPSTRVHELVRLLQSFDSSKQ